MTVSINKVCQSGFASISSLCACFGVKRDSYYKRRKRQSKSNTETDSIVAMIKERRKELPREGCRKLYVALKTDFQARGIRIGRDKLFHILRSNSMLIKRKRSYVKTTNSMHRFYKYKNQIKNIVINKPNQVWVSDITYIKLYKGHCYLALITDAFSRKILGYDVSDSLELAGCQRALKNAIRYAKPEPGLIHHSDRGIQYCSYQYVEQLIKNKVEISMTEENHCYENALAERVNGILKDEFYLDQCFENLKQVRKVCKNAIDLYNRKRLHLSLGYKTPDEVFKIGA